MVVIFKFLKIHNIKIKLSIMTLRTCADREDSPKDETLPV